MCIFVPHCVYYSFLCANLCATKYLCVLIYVKFRFCVLKNANRITDVLLHNYAEFSLCYSTVFLFITQLRRVLLLLNTWSGLASSCRLGLLSDKNFYAQLSIHSFMKQLTCFISNLKKGSKLRSQIMSRAKNLSISKT